MKDIDFDEILTNWSYKLPKGFPTIIDGKFTKRAEVIILNQLLEEKGLRTLPLPEADNDEPAKVEPKFVSWYKTVDKSTITSLLETAPIVESLIKGRVTIENLISTVKNNPAMDWSPDILRVIDSMEEAGVLADEASLDYLNNSYLMGKEASSPISQQTGNNIKSLNGGTPISSFIHGKVRGFYDLINANTKSEKNKVFTADVIVFWNVENPFDSKIQQAIVASIKNPKIEQTSLVNLGDGRYMACVSLKANEGRIGKLTAWTSKYKMNENLLASLKNTFMQSSFGKALVAGYQKVQEIFNGIYNKLKSKITVDNPDVVSYEEGWSALEELEDLINTDKSLVEGNDDKIQCTTCHRKQVQKIQGFVESALNGTALDEFKSGMKKYEDGNLLRTRYRNVNLDKLNDNTGRTALQETMKRILEASTQGKESSSKCSPLYEDNEPLIFSRAEFKNLIFNNGNALSLNLIQRIIQDTIKQIDLNKVKETKDSLLRLTTSLSTEALFGKSAGLPLVKYTGTSMYQLGTKEDYSKNKREQLGRLFSQGKEASQFPMIAIRVEPSKGKGKVGEAPYYFNITMYTLDDIETESGKVIDPKEIKYIQIGFKCNSGSNFAFVVEADTSVDGKKLLALLDK